MSGRLLRLTGTVLVLAIALVAPALVTSVVVSSPAFGDVLIDGCTVVSNPTPSDHTTCPGADFAGSSLTGLNLSYANLAGAVFVTCTNGPPASAANCIDADLTDDNLVQANLSGAVLSANTTMGPVSIYGLATGDANLTGADLAGADLSGATGGTFATANLSGADLTNGNFGTAVFTAANLADASLAGAVMTTTIEPFGVTVSATLTGANLTGTILVPPNQTAAATSQVGAVATWSTPAGIPGATPGTCTPASGSTFPLFTSTVTCQVLDSGGNVATGTFAVTVTPTTQYFTRVLVPPDGSVLSGRLFLDAGAGDAPGVTKVVFELTGGALNDQVIATATPTLFGWLAQWDSASVPNGTYTLQSVATDSDARTDTSTAISVTVSNPTPASAVVLPADGATLKGSPYLDATASSDVSTVVYELSGGPSHLTEQVATASLTSIGWAAVWNTTGVPDGTYDLQSVASYADGVSGTSTAVTITVGN